MYSGIGIFNFTAADSMLHAQLFPKFHSNYLFKKNQLNTKIIYVCRKKEFYSDFHIAQTVVSLSLSAFLKFGKKRT